jgi:hypothetical protein
MAAAGAIGLPTSSKLVACLTPDLETVNSTRPGHWDWCGATPYSDSGMAEGLLSLMHHSEERCITNPRLPKLVQVLKGTADGRIHLKSLRDNHGEQGSMHSSSSTAAYLYPVETSMPSVEVWLLGLSVNGTTNLARPAPAPCGFEMIQVQEYFGRPCMQ